MTTTGLDELMAASDAFPAELTRALQGVAEATGRRILNRAQAILRAKVRGTPIVITMHSDVSRRQVEVRADFTRGQPTSMPLWFETGTAPRQQKAGRRTGQITALHYMRDSAAAEEAQHRRDLEAAAVDVAKRVFR